MTQNETHLDVVERVAAEGWDFHPQFIRKLIGEQAEYKEATLLHVLAGKIPDKTGRHFCPYCDGYMDESACSVFEKRAKEWLKREVLMPHMEATCPECHTPIDDMRDARVVKESPVLTREEVEEKDLSDLPAPETELKTIYKPCECLHEHGDGKIRWDLDKSSVREAVQNGGLAAFYDGPVFRSVVGGSNTLDYSDNQTYNMIQPKQLAMFGIGGAVGARLVASGASSEIVLALGVALVFTAVVADWARQNVFTSE